MPEKVRPEKVRPQASGDVTDTAGEPIDAAATTTTATTGKGATAVSPAAGSVAKGESTAVPNDSRSETAAGKARSAKKTTAAQKAESSAPASDAAALKTAAPAKVKRRDIGDRSWVPWVFVPVGLIGVAWLVVYYIVGDFMPGVTGGWNILVGMGCMAAAFAIATLWK